MKKKLATLLGLLFLASTVQADLIGDLGDTLADAVYTPIYNSIHDLLTELMDLVIEILVWNPPLDSAYESWNIVRTVITSMYLAVLTYAGLKLMTQSMIGDSERNTLKKWVGGSIASLLMVNMSYVLYGFIIQLNVGLSALVYEQPSMQGFIVASAAFVLLMFFQTTAVLLVILLLIVRALLVLVGVVLFPIAIFLYYLPPTKRFGKLISTLVFANIFIQFFEVLCLRVSMDAFGSIGGSFTSSIFNAVFGVAMMYLMLVVPLISYGFAAIAGAILHKATEVVTNVVPVPIHLENLRVRGR